MNYRDDYLLSTSISREDIDVILLVELVLIIATTRKTNYCKSATGDAGILGIRKDTRRTRLLSLPIISDSQDIFVSVTH